MNQAIITIAEADAFLILFPLWTVLTDPEKQDHIAKASVYIQTRWECADVDWTDDLTIPDVVKEACAYYAYADLSGNLYGELDGTFELHGKLRSTKDKVGSLATEKSWYRGGTSDPPAHLRPLAYPNALMSSVCVNKSATCGVDLVRD